MHINEIVFTQGLYDAGLCIGEENGLPIIHGRCSKYSDSIYGGVQFVEWVSSGVYCTKYEWDSKTNDKMSTQDIMNVFGIIKQNLLKTPCKIEDGGWREMQKLTAFLTDCGYVKQGKSAKLAHQIMSKFEIKNKNEI